MQYCLSERGHDCVVYSQNHACFSGDARPIARLPFLPRFIRGAAYRWIHGQVVILEQARWLQDEISRLNDGRTLFEFADFMGYAFFALRGKTLRKHIIVRIHTPAFLITGNARGAAAHLADWVCSIRERSTLRRALHISAPSQAFLSEKLPWLKKGRYLPNPSPPSALTHPPSQPMDASAFLYLGRLEPRKGVHILLSAFDRLLEAKPETRLTLAGECGDSEYGRSLQAAWSEWPQAKRSRVTWLPGQSPSQVKALLQSHAFLVAPSLWENSPYVFFEAIASGRIALGSVTGEMGAVLEECRSPRALPGSVDSLLAAMRQALAPDFSYAEQTALQMQAMEKRQANAVEGFLGMADEIVGKSSP